MDKLAPVSSPVIQRCEWSLHQRVVMTHKALSACRAHSPHSWRLDNDCCQPRHTLIDVWGTGSLRGRTVSSPANAVPKDDVHGCPGRHRGTLRVLGRTVTSNEPFGKRPKWQSGREEQVLCSGNWELRDGTQNLQGFRGLIVMSQNVDPSPHLAGGKMQMSLSQPALHWCHSG